MQNEKLPGARNRSFFILLPSFCLFLALAACWVIPYRLYFGAGGSRYNFGYTGDEYLYAARVQPLIPGATAANPFNGIADPAVVSQYYLEDTCRAFLSLTGMDVVTFFWLWRLLFPLVLAASLYGLARVCMPRTRRPWARELRWAAAAAAFPLIFLGYDLVTRFPPLQGFVNRIPSNIEYPLSILMARLFLRFLKSPAASSGASLAACSAALVYLRPYAAVPWGLAVIAGVLIGIIARAVSVRSALTALGVLLAALIPWIFAVMQNSKSQAYAEMLVRFYPLRPYEIHPQWVLFIGISAILLLAGLFLRNHARVFAWSCAWAMLVLPFVCALLRPAHELLRFDRFGVFYLIVLAASAMLVLGERSFLWKGRAGFACSRRTSTPLIAVGLAGALLLSFINSTYDLTKYPDGPEPFIAADLPFVPAYQWVRENTPPGALFLVDDGIDWEAAPLGSPAYVAAMYGDFAKRDDLFQIVAHRRRVYQNRLTNHPLSNADYWGLSSIQLETFGGHFFKSQWSQAFARIHPDYILWRKTAPIPRGHGAELKLKAQVVHTDNFCEIWKMNW